MDMGKCGGGKGGWREVRVSREVVNSDLFCSVTNWSCWRCLGVLKQARVVFLAETNYNATVF